MVDYRNFERFLHSRMKRRNLIIGAGALSGLAIALTAAIGENLFFGSL
ncbi:MAG: hypothetical protein V7K55_23595 [Nostoc sp.]